MIPLLGASLMSPIIGVAGFIDCKLNTLALAGKSDNEPFKVQFPENVILFKLLGNSELYL